jgi:hypothetical protein
LENSHSSRQFPPTMLEWRANKKRVGMALEAKCADGFTRHAAAESMTTAEEFASFILDDRELASPNLELYLCYLGVSIIKSHVTMQFVCSH